MDNNLNKRSKKKSKEKSSKAKKRKSKKSSTEASRKEVTSDEPTINQSEQNAYNSNDDNDKSQMTDTASLTHGSNTSSQSTPPADSADTYRWVNQLSDSDEECHRLETYKLKRRERYQAAARRAIAAAAASCNTGGFLARINVRDRQPLRMPSIYATNSNISVPLYRNTVGSMTKLTTITC